MSGTFATYSPESGGGGGGGGITQLTGDVTAGPGSGVQAATVALVGGSTATAVNSATILANASTSANTASTIVRRDGSGNFAAGTITASLTGNSTGVTGLTASRALVSSGGGALTPATTTATEIGYVNGVTSSIQAQLDAKQPTITVLPIANGGTNSSTALSNNRVVQSSGGALVEAAAITASRALISDANGIPTQSVTTSAELAFVNGVTSSIQTQLNAKQPTITVLPVANGGTNSSTALNNNRVVQSSGGAIVEAAAITASRALVSDTNGIPVAATTTTTEINFVNGVTSAIQTQLNGKQATITVLPVANGGTNSSTALNNNRVMQSSGGAVVEAAAITASRALISDANGIPTQSVTTSAELAFVNGVTSAIQTQINAKFTTATATPSAQGLVTSFVPTVASSTKAISGAGYTILTADGYRLVEVTTGVGGQTVTLPALSSNLGRIITVKKVDNGAGTVTIARAGSDTIEGATQTIITAQYSYVTLYGGATWEYLAANDYVEVKTSGDQNLGASATYQDMSTVAGSGSLVLDAGEWEIVQHVAYNLNGAVATGAVISGIGTASGSSSTGLSDDDGSRAQSLSPSSTNSVFTHVSIRRLITASTTYYAKVRAAYTGGPITYAGIMYAKRLNR